MFYKALRFKKVTVLSFVGLTSILLSCLSPALAFAAITHPTAKPYISFTFDDGLASVYTQAAPTLAAHGLVGTSYVTTGCVGMTTTPNNCEADGSAPYMTWEQVQAIQNTYGWEIGGHTVTHPQLATDNLTDAQLTQEVTGSKQALAAHGINANALATPYGDYDARALAEIAKEYTSHRGFHDVDANAWPLNDYLLNNMQVQGGVTVAQVKTRIDQAIANNEWLILTFHDIKQSGASSDPEDYQFSTANLAEIAAYVQTKQAAQQISNVTVSKGLVASSTNLLANSSFDQGIAAGWTTNNSAVVTQDTGRHGSAVAGSTTGATNAAKLVATNSNAYLFSPMATVDSQQQYMVKSFLNLTSRTSGEIGYYIDEYDANGNWISGQWKHSETVPYVKSVNLAYTPSSAAVKKASLQIYVDANSGITAYVDNVQFFSLTQETTTPPPSTNPVNVMPNSTFDNGIGDGWTTDNPVAIQPDSNNNGSTENPAKSVKLTAGTTNAHLFAPKVNVDSTLTYTLKAFLKVLTLTSGEIGFYIDEYDANGNWISGQYVTGKRTVGDETISFEYTPSSANVKRAGLQIILVGNSGITGYLDNVQWLAPAGSTPPPETDPTPDPDPTPAPTPILEEEFTDGLTGWTTNTPANVVADASGNGGTTEAQNSVKMTAGAANIHLFSSKIAVTAQAYAISSFVNITAMTSGELAFYIDEYDASGNWISGQYVTAKRTAGSENISFSYTPSSANVAQASLQVIVTGNSGITAYVDGIKWAPAS